MIFKRRSIFYEVMKLRKLMAYFFGATGIMYYISCLSEVAGNCVSHTLWIQSVKREYMSALITNGFNVLHW